MRKRRLLYLAGVVILILLVLSGCRIPETPKGTTGEGPQQPAVPPEPPRKEELSLEDYNGGFFTIKKPAGWDVVTGGSCSTFAFVIRDTSNPTNQIFYFNEVGPVYLAEEQKGIDSNYMQMGGYPIVWFEMPVINPLTPENFLENFYLIASTDIARSFMPGVPELNHVEIISSDPEPSLLSGGQASTMRALFTQGGELGEGLFYLTVAPVLPLMGAPGGGIGYGFSFAGISSAKDDFKEWQGTLVQSIQSLTISQSYIDGCIQQQNEQYKGILKAGKTLSETSDIIMDSWENRNESDDIISEKRSDAILGRERVYNPDTGEVYQVENGFYDGYNLHRQEYSMNDLRLLPNNDWDLWTSPTLPGSDID